LSIASAKKIKQDTETAKSVEKVNQNQAKLLEKQTQKAMYEAKILFDKMQASSSASDLEHMRNELDKKFLELEKLLDVGGKGSNVIQEFLSIFKRGRRDTKDVNIIHKRSK